MEDIELVVKIPEVEYEHLTNKEKFYSLEKNKQEWLINKILNRVIDGTPLSKGHGDLIDRSELLKEPIDKANYPSNYVKIAKAIIEADKEQKNGNDD